MLVQLTLEKDFPEIWHEAESLPGRERALLDHAPADHHGHCHWDRSCRCKDGMDEQVISKNYSCSSPQRNVDGQGWNEDVFQSSPQFIVCIGSWLRRSIVWGSSSLRSEAKQAFICSSSTILATSYLANTGTYSVAGWW